MPSTRPEKWSMTMMCTENRMEHKNTSRSPDETEKPCLMHKRYSPPRASTTPTHTKGLQRRLKNSPSTGTMTM